MRAASLFLVFMFSAFAAQSASATEGPWHVHITLKVWRCLGATFEAPENFAPMSYVAGDRYRTNIIHGTVVDTKVFPRRTNESSENIERAIAGFPKAKDSVSFAMVAYDSQFCDAVVGKEKKFVYYFGCDTAPERGACMSPLPLLIPLAPKGER